MTPAEPVTTRLVLITPPELAWGFRLAGARAVAAASPVEAGAVLERLAGEGGIGVVAVYAPFLDALDPVVRRRLEESVPVVVRLPAGLGPEAGEGRRTRLAELLQRAVGYHITFPGTGP